MYGSLASLFACRLIALGRLHARNTWIQLSLNEYNHHILRHWQKRFFLCWPKQARPELSWAELEADPGQIVIAHSSYCSWTFRIQKRNKDNQRKFPCLETSNSLTRAHHTCDNGAREWKSDGQRAAEREMEPIILDFGAPEISDIWE